MEKGRKKEEQAQWKGAEKVQTKLGYTLKNGGVRQKAHSVPSKPVSKHSVKKSSAIVRGYHKFMGATRGPGPKKKKTND